MWASVLPLEIVPGKAIADDRLIEGLEIPDYVQNYALNQLKTTSK